MSEFYHLLLLLTIFQSSLSQRRIKDGQEVTSDKRYVVYFLKADSAPVLYQGWTCGGAIVNVNFIITSAACVQDVQRMYAIAGYKHFLPSTKLKDDNCFKYKKKKVILTCVPKSYQFSYNKTELWSAIDIAVVKVDSPYDFNDTTFERYCSYIPGAILVNFEIKYQQAGSDAMILGWGHADEYRQEKDLTDFNLETLHYVPTRILDKASCIKHYKANKALPVLIMKYMICTSASGILDDKGELLRESVHDNEGCITLEEKLNGAIGRMCEEIPEVNYEDQIADIGGLVLLDESRRQDKTKRIEGKTRRQDVANEPQQPDKKETQQPDEIEPQPHVENEPQQTINKQDFKIDVKEVGKEVGEEVVTEVVTEVGTEVKKEDEYLDPEPLDTPGICQNDHGGPLVTWMGTHEILIGVATLFKVDSNLKCRGPYLFTSTQCNSAFLNCILSTNATESRRNCNLMEENGLTLIKRRISWIGHRDGPADNEMIEVRPQIPMRNYSLH